MDILSILHSSKSHGKNRYVPKKAIIKAVEEKFSLESYDDLRFTTAYYDTFDWRVFYEGYICCVQEGKLHLIKNTNSAHATVPFSKESRSVLELKELPKGNLRKRLSAAIGIRKLMKRGTIDSSISFFNIRNSDEKIITRCVLEHYSADAPGEKRKQGVLVHCKALRGYEQESKKVGLLLGSIGVQPLRATRTMFLLSECGAVPGDYTSKFLPKLEQSGSSLSALLSICRGLILTMEANKEGILQDIDPEFLHDFRVAIRRIRSAVTLIRGVLPQDVRKEMQIDFQEIASHTALLRDLDVYLGRKEEYTELLQDSFKKDIQPFFISLKTARRETLKNLRMYLMSEEYAAVISKWKLYTAGKTGFSEKPGSNAQVEVVETASAVLVRQFRKLMKDCRKVGTSSGDEAIHKIRIDFKKLRYLLEFFSSLFPGKEKRALLKTLKNVQDTLGNFNDCSVQIAALEERVEELQGKGGINLKEAVAIGGVITHLQLRKQKYIHDFLGKLTELSSRDLENSFIRVFGG